MRITINANHKSIPRGISFDLPDFCVLTGKNGSGKTHLLEAIASPSISTVSIASIQIVNIHHVGFNGLNPQLDEQCDTVQVMGNINNWWSQISGVKEQCKQAISRGEEYDGSIVRYLPMHGHNPLLPSIIARIIEGSKRGLNEITYDDVLSNLRFSDANNNQLFFSQFALIFKAYHTRLIKNQFAEFRNEKKLGLPLPFLSSEEFFKKHGPPPWDLVNDLLKMSNLPYEVPSPESDDFDLPYRLRLIDRNSGLDISANDLSSGEKVLMSIALAIYNTQEGGAKPDLLLLDEPDAPLHPQFSKLLIDTIVETIVNKAGIKVIITTHSPSTVAMAPNGSVFEVDRETKIPRIVSNKHAVEILTEGIPFLKVSYNKRRQIFVESKYDVQYFERFYNVLSRRHNFEFQPIFLEPHSGTSNCSDVISIVEKLRSAGSDLAFGVIDFDGVNKSKESIFVLGGGIRYAIDNYILDPIYVALALIRGGKKNFNDFGVPGRNVYTDASSLGELECQAIVDSFLSAIGLPLCELSPTKTEGGFIINYPKSFLLHQGHEYEERIRRNFIELNSICKGKGDAVLKLGIMQVIEEFPQFLPNELGVTFENVIGRA